MKVRIAPIQSVSPISSVEEPPRHHVKHPQNKNQPIHSPVRPKLIRIQPHPVMESISHEKVVERKSEERLKLHSIKPSSPQNEKHGRDVIPAIGLGGEERIHRQDQPYSPKPCARMSDHAYCPMENAKSEFNRVNDRNDRNDRRNSIVKNHHKGLQELREMYYAVKNKRA